MRARHRTGFDKFFAEQMKSPRLAAEYRRARAEIDAVDQLVRALDEARLYAGITKAELARRISAKPEIVRRLFTTVDPNPTLETVIKLAAALGYRLQLVRASGKRPSARRRAA
jgi:ribosome-binding protein aMBF1 (putative translation factor)